MSEKTKLSADLTELRKKISFVKNGLGVVKSDLPTQLIRLETAGNKLAMFAASKEMLCRCEMKAARDEGASDGSFAVLGSKLAALVSTAEAERITFEVDQENCKATAGFLTVNLTLYDGASLKQIEQGCSDDLKAEGTATSRETFEEALTCGRACTTTDSIRPDVNHVELRQGKLLASDGRKITLYSSVVFFKEQTFKVPNGTLNNLISALKGIEAEKIQLREGASYYFVKGNLSEYAIGVRKTERTFPEVETTIAKGTEAPDDEVSVDKHVLTAALAGVALGLENDEVKVTFEISGEGTDTLLEVSALNNLGRRSFERMSCGRTGTGPLSFPVSYRHLLDTLSVFKGDSVVDLGINTKLGILSVRDVNEVRQVLTLVPFRTDTQIQAEKAERAEREEARKVKAKTDTTEDSEAVLQEAVEEETELA